MAAAVFCVQKACVTVYFASYQAAAVEDELQQHCSTAGDANFDSPFLPNVQVPVLKYSYKADRYSWLPFQSILFQNLLSDTYTLFYFLPSSNHSSYKDIHQ